MKILIKSNDQTEEEITNLNQKIAQLQGQLQACRDKPSVPAPPPAQPRAQPRAPAAPTSASDNGGGISSFLPSIGSIPNPFNIFGSSTPETPGTPDTPEPTGGPVRHEEPVEDPIDPQPVGWDNQIAAVKKRADQKYGKGAVTSMAGLLKKIQSVEEFDSLLNYKNSEKKLYPFARAAGIENYEGLELNQIRSAIITKMDWKLQPPLRF